MYFTVLGVDMNCLIELLLQYNVGNWLFIVKNGKFGASTEKRHKIL